MKKSILAITMILILVLTSTIFAYAEGQTRDTNLVYFAIDRTSRTTAAATVDVTFSNYVDKYNVTIYLQKKIDNRWVSDVTNPDYVFSKSGTNALDYTFSHLYSNLTAGVNYRLKCVSTDSVGSSNYTATTYSNQF